MCSLSIKKGIFIGTRQHDFYWNLRLLVDINTCYKTTIIKKDGTGENIHRHIIDTEEKDLKKIKILSV